MRVYLAGHTGMVGGSILRRLEARDDIDEIVTRTHAEVDLIDQHATRSLLSAARPDVVILAAAHVGGIHANATFPADFIYRNLMIQSNVIHQAFRAGVERLLFLGSSCIYPAHADQPMGEEALLTGPLEPTNEPYAVAKIAGITMCESYNRQHGTDYRSLMPTNLYGPGDNFHLEHAHVVPALLRRFHEAARADAQVVDVWGSGTPRREFLHVDDLAEAALFVLDLPRERYASVTEPMRSHLNVGTGSDLSIAALADLIAEITGFRGEVAFDTSRPDGTPRKLLDVTRLESLGWRASTGLRQGLEATYRWFVEHGDASTAQ